MGLAEDVAAFNWYHTIELPGGVVTPGMYDTRASAKSIPMPESLSEKRCLDIGTSDGFWAFEMERRGAAEVVAIDTDPSARDHTRNAQKEEPPGPSRETRAFTLAHSALGSRVIRKEISIYELSPETVGTFDFVFLGSILVHLRDPVAALVRVRSVTDGELLSYEAVSPMLSLIHPRFPAAHFRGNRWNAWWLPNKACHRQMIQASGFDLIAHGGVSYVKSPGTKFSMKAFLKRPLTTLLVSGPGIPQAWVRAKRGSNAPTGATLR